MIKSQFNYCPLVWMFCSRQSKFMKRDFQQILREQNEITIHQRNLQVLMTEVYKIVNGIAPPIITSFFQFCCNTNNIKNFQKFFAENRKTVKYVTKTVTYGGPLLLANLYSKYKNTKSLDEFKSKIKA